MRWIVGVDGVGKSAIMQNVIESPKLPGTSTLTYQLAVKSEPYRQIIQDAIDDDLSLLQSPMPTRIQFQKFVVEPFAHHSQLKSIGRVSIIINGLDECGSPRTQIEHLRLISEFCLLYPSSPIVWLIASRPEPHFTAFFSSLYKLAIGEVVYGIQRGDPDFQNVFCIHLLTAQFRMFYGYFPLRELCDLVFDESRYQEFTMRGIIEKIPLRAIDVSSIFSNAKLHFYRPGTAVANLPDPWDITCTHQRIGEGEEGKDCNWVTSFGVDDCACCYSRLADQLGGLKIRTPDRAVPILFTSTGSCCVEFRFVDEKDSMSEWRYWFGVDLLKVKFE